MNMDPKYYKKIPGPAVVLDLEAFEKNLKLAEKMALAHGKLIRPHFKTHRCPGLALRQLGPAIKGMTCATVPEAEAVAQAGIKDILVANEVTTPEKIKRLVKLAQHARVLVGMDAPENAAAFSQAASRAGVQIGVLVDLDIGLGRCGARSINAALKLAAYIKKLPALEFRGIMGYEGRHCANEKDRGPRVQQAMDTLQQTKAALIKNGHVVEIVSASGTSTFNEALASKAITEIQAGSYISMEKNLAGLNLPFVCSVWVLAAVVSRSHQRVVVNSGRRTIGIEYGLPEVVKHTAQVTSVNDEQSILRWKGALPALGQGIFLRPSQVRSTFNLNETVWLVKKNRIVGSLPITVKGSA